MPTVIGPIQRKEVKRVVFDFVDEMEENEEITGTPTLDVYMKSGVDPNKDDIVVDGPFIDTTKVYWDIAYQIPKVTYYLQANCRTSYSPLAHTLTAELKAQEFA